MYATMLVGVIALIGLFLGVILFLEVGRRIRLRLLSREAEKFIGGLGVVEGALFGLMGLVIAFTFSGAASRFDDRRHFIVEEANTIGTAYLRLDVLPLVAQPQMREMMRRYIDSRIQTYRVLPDYEAALAEMAKSSEIQRAIWDYAVSATKDAPNPQAAMVLLPALNEMFDIANTRFWAGQLHPPPMVFMLLGVLALVCALLAGFGMAGGTGRHWVHIVAFAIILTLTVYVIIDVEYPRLGFIRVDSFDQALIDVRANMK